MNAGWLRHAAILLIALVLDDKLAPHFSLLGVTPDFVLPAVLVITLRMGPAAGAWAGFAAGLFIDVATPELLGARALALAVAAFVTGRTALQVDVGSLPVQALLLAALGFIDAVSYQAVTHFAQPGVAMTRLFAREIPSVIYTTLLTLPALLVLGRKLLPVRARWRESA
jgi:rod shape-determining protein MreD